MVVLAPLSAGGGGPGASVCRWWWPWCLCLPVVVVLAAGGDGPGRRRWFWCLCLPAVVALVPLSAGGGIYPPTALAGHAGRHSVRRVLSCGKVSFGFSSLKGMGLGINKLA